MLVHLSFPEQSSLPFPQCTCKNPKDLIILPGNLARHLACSLQMSRFMQRNLVNQLSVKLVAYAKFVLVSLSKICLWIRLYDFKFLSD